MTISYFLLILVAILQRILYIGLPALGIYGIVRVCATSDSDIDPILRSHLFGLGKKGHKWILLVWILCYILVGVILYDFAMWYRFGINPLIQIPPITLK